MMLDQILPPPALVPAILIELRGGRWCATAVIAADGDPVGVDGPSTSHGGSPAGALDKLLGRHFGRDIADDLPATLIAIDRTQVLDAGGRS